LLRGQEIPHQEAVTIRNALATALCAAFLAIAAQALTAQNLSVGGRLGVAGSEVLFEDQESNDFKQPLPGLQIGGFVAYAAGSILTPRAELWLVQKGFTETEAGGGRRLTYLELPLFLTVAAPWTTAPQLLVGASGSVELGCAVTDVPDVGSVSCDDPRVAWQRAKWQFGGWIGLGVRRKLGRSRLELQLLVNLNLTNLNLDPLPRGDARLLTGAVSATYAIPLGGR
jgi:hypothetical protein